MAAFFSFFDGTEFSPFGRGGSEKSRSESLDEQLRKRNVLDRASGHSLAAGTAAIHRTTCKITTFE